MKYGDIVRPNHKGADSWGRTLDWTTLRARCASGVYSAGLSATAEDVIDVLWLTESPWGPRTDGYPVAMLEVVSCAR